MVISECTHQAHITWTEAKYQFHQCSFYAYRSQKQKIDSEVTGDFALLGSTRKKDLGKHVGEINPSLQGSSSSSIEPKIPKLG